MIAAKDLVPHLGWHWSQLGNGPYDYNCWNYLRYLQKNLFGVDIPKVDTTDAELCTTLFREKMDSGLWAPIEFPVHGAGVLMRGGNFPHVGVFLTTSEGMGIAHCMQGAGANFASIHVVRQQGFARLRYYRLT